MVDSFINIVFEQVKEISIPIFIISILVGVIFIVMKAILLERLYKKKIDFIDLSLEILIIVCISFFYQVTFYNRDAGSRVDFIRLPFTRIFDKYGNIHLKELLYSLFNVILFVPWGLFLSLYKRRLRFSNNLLLVASYSFIATLIIECTQLISKRGYFEIEDIICNVTGGLIGALFGNIYILYVNKK